MSREEEEEEIKYIRKAPPKDFNFSWKFFRFNLYCWRKPTEEERKKARSEYPISLIFPYTKKIKQQILYLDWWGEDKLAKFTLRIGIYRTFKCFELGHKHFMGCKHWDTFKYFYDIAEKQKEYE